jgi:uncharacterized damage-inducible protein DinB
MDGREIAMNSVEIMKSNLYEELRLNVRTTSGLLRKVRAGDWSFRPIESMRTLGELAQHLALVPAVDLLILKEHSEPDIRELEGRYADVTDADKLIDAMERGMNDLVAYMDGLSDEQFLAMTTTPFYVEHPTTQAKWLLEIVTHAQHHRAQLFTYMKQLGYEINMFDLY